jgi:hypothetical protein
MEIFIVLEKGCILQPFFVFNESKRWHGACVNTYR